MVTKNSTFALTFEKGLNEFIEASRLEPGFSVICKNWVPEPDGSLRVRVGWIQQDNGGQPVNRRVRAIAFVPRTLHGGVTAPGYVIASAETAGQYTIKHILASELANAAHNWADIESVVVADNTDHVAFTFAGGHMLYCTDSFATIRAWKSDTALGGANPFALANSRPGRTMAFYKNRIWTGGGVASADPVGAPETVNTYSTQPYRLWASGLLGRDLATDVVWDTTSLTNPAGFIDIGKDDGQAIEYITPYDQGLLVGKTDSMYYVSGTSPANASVTQLDAGECSPGRTIVTTPYGAIIAGRTECFIYKGNIPEPIDTPVEESYEMTGNFQTITYIDGKVYIVDDARDLICVYDLENDAWHTETVGFNPGVAFAYQSEMLLGPNSSATIPLLMYREIPTGDREIDDGLGMLLHVKSPELWLGGATHPVTVRHVYVRYRQRAGNAADMDATVNVIQNGAVVTSQSLEVQAAAGVYRKRFDVKGTTYSLQFEFIQVNTSTDEAVIDLEEIEIVFDEEEDR